MKVNTSLGQRMIAFALALILVLGMVPVNPIAADDVSSYGVVAGTAEGMTVSGSATAKVTVSFAGAISRNASLKGEGWWLGIQVTAPEDMAAEQLEKATYKENAEEKSFWAEKTSAENVHTVTLWTEVTAEALRAANLAEGVITRNWKFNWDGEGAAEQEITLSIDADSTMLLDAEGVRVYPAASLGLGVAEALVGAPTITGNGSSNVVVNYNTKTKLEYQAPGAIAGQSMDGWWLGIKVTAPEGVTAEQMQKAQYKLNGELRSFWEDMASAEDASVYYLDLWINMNGLLTDSFEPPVYSFDWNNDGLFEQNVKMALDSSRITLMKNGQRLFYLMGTVESMDKGNLTITGSGESEVKVTAENLTLYFTEADLNDDRDREGWWACLRVTAPKNVTIGEKQNEDVRYQTALTEDPQGQWSTTKSMYKDQDSEKDAAVHYMNLWTYVDLEKIANNEEIHSHWRFDWDKDGRYEQTISYTILAGGVKTLYVSSEAFHFLDTTEGRQIPISDLTYQNAAETTVDNAKIYYSIESNPEGLATVDGEGLVTFNNEGKLGEVTIIATLVLSSGYEAQSIGYTFKIIKAELSGFTIKEPSDFVYGTDGNLFVNEAIDPTGNGVIKYIIRDQAYLEGGLFDETDPVAQIPNEAEGKVEILRSGVITVDAIRAEDEHYQETIATYTMKIVRAGQTGAFVDAPTKLSFSESKKYPVPEVAGYENAAAEITYEIKPVEEPGVENKGPVAELIEEDGKVYIQTKRQGYFLLCAHISGNDCYEAQTIETEIYVALAYQDMSAFLAQGMEGYEAEDKKVRYTVTFNENGNKFVNPVTGGSGDGEVSYQILCGADVAELELDSQDKATGTLIIKKAGKVLVEATKLGGDQYENAVVKYVLTVNKAEQEFDFTNDTPEILYGVEEFTNEQILALVQPALKESAADGKGFGEGSYTIEVAENTIGAVKDGESVKFQPAEEQVGTVAVTVTKAADDCYESCSATFNLTVVYPQQPEYTVVDSDKKEFKPNEAGWYNRDIIIKPAEGWLVSATNGRDTADWATSWIYSVESDGSVIPAFAFKNTADGSITAMTDIQTYKMDKTDPDLTIEYGNLTWFEILAKKFGFAADTVKVTLKAEDALSGIAYIYYSTDGGKSIDRRNNIPVDAATAEYTFQLNPQYRDSVVFWAVDNAGNTVEFTDGKTLVVDAVEPGLVVEYDFNGAVSVPVEEKHGEETREVIYAQDETKLTFKITADNFDLSETPVVKVNGQVEPTQWTTEDLISTGTVTLPVNGDYVVTAEFTDRLGRGKSETVYVKTDNTKPEIEIREYKPAEGNENGLYFQEARAATIVVTEHNFNPAEVTIAFTTEKTNSQEQPVKLYDENGNVIEDLTKLTWTKDNDKDEYSTTVMFKDDGEYTFTVDCVDLAKNGAEQYAAEPFVVDKAAPTGLTISYSDPMPSIGEMILEAITFGFYNPDKDNKLTVTVTAEDVTSGVDYFQWKFIKDGTSEKNMESFEEPLKISEESNDEKDAFESKFKAEGDKYTATFEIPAEARGYVSVMAADKAGNKTAWVNENNDEGVIRVVDTAAPEVEVVYEVPDNTILVERDNTYHTNQDTAVTFKITEANFDINPQPPVVNVKVESELPEARLTELQEQIQNLTWTEDENEEDVWTAELVLDAEANELVKYTVSLYYIDGAHNDVTYTQELHIDKQAPDVTVLDSADGMYFRDERTATIQIIEHNFDPEKVSANLTAKNIIDDLEVKLYDTNDKEIDLKNQEVWTSNGDTHTVTVKFKDDAQYTFFVECSDIFDQAFTSPAETFTVDTKAPEELSISYSDPVASVVDTIDTIMEAITFGFYNPREEENRPLIVTVTATDVTSGVDYFLWKFTKDGTSKNNMASFEKPLKISEASNEEKDDFRAEFKADGDTFTATFEIPAKTRGYISVMAADKAGNATKEWIVDANRINIVDTIAPKGDEDKGAVSYSDAHVVNAETMEDVTSDEEVENVIAYYNGKGTEDDEKNGKKNAEASINIIEANFYEEDVVLLVKNDRADVETPKITWEDHENDLHTGKFTLTEEGVYTINMSYTDRSQNETLTYSSHPIVLDHTEPKVDIALRQDAPNKECIVTITIDEENFRPNEVELSISAKDVAGANMTVTESRYAEVAKTWAPSDVVQAEGWTSNGNLHKLVLVFDSDANYELGVAYADLAGNPAEAKSTAFTVDKTPPVTEDKDDKGFQPIEYDLVVSDAILDSIFFGYYDAQMTVRIYAKDEVSGVESFKFSYLTEEGVSSINIPAKDLISTDVDHETGTHTFTTSFKIPMSVKENLQFRGYVEFEATDKCGNVSTKYIDGNHVVVVDTIAPTATISYNTPTNRVGEVDYYDGNIYATIVVNEANFYPEDAKVRIKRNGGDETAVAVNWVRNNADVSTGTFTISDEGDYVVLVDYEDRSKNAMTSYVSGQLTVDKTDPVIELLDMKHEAADNSETIGLTIQVTDRNITAGNFRPILQAVVKDDDKTFKTVDIDLGEVSRRTANNGDTIYSYTVENLEIDGYYTLTCEAIDNANRTVTAIRCQTGAEGEEKDITVDAVNSSVNREGSTFSITTVHTEDREKVENQLSGKYVNGDVILTIKEINVDKVDEGKKTVFTLNNGTSSEVIDLTEANYKKNVSIGAGGWYETTYTLDESYFQDDGVYSINVITYDAADNSNVNSKSEEGTITFTVDRTKPVISANISSNQIIDAPEYKVHFQVTESNLDPETILVTLNGKPVELEDLGNNEYAFTVKEGLGQNVTITATDLAGNESDVFTAESFTVSTNFFVRWYANTTLFWLSIGGVVLLAGIIIVVIVLKKKKQED